jgi:DNA repair exonuclease SbcCD ATPase subunit
VQGGKELPEIIKEVESHLARLKRDLTATASTEDLYRKFISLSQASHSCPLCDRSFPTDGELSSFTSKLRDLVAAIPTAASSSSKRCEVDAAEARLSKLLELRSVWDDSCRLTRDLPAAKSLEASLAQQSSDAAKAVSELSKAVVDARAEATRAQAILSATREAKELKDKLQTATASLTAAEERLERESVDKRSLEDVRREFDAKQKTAGELSSKIDGLRDAAARGTKEIAA